MSVVQGIVNPFDVTAHLPAVVSEYTKQFFINRCPLMTRLNRVYIGSDSYTIARRRQRKRTYALAADIAAAGTATATLAVGDAGLLMIGDVLKVEATGERIEVIADPNTSTDVISIARGVGDTAAAAVNIPAGGSGTDSAVLTLIGNSRTGGEVDQNGFFADETPITQYIQHSMYPVQIAGALLDVTELRLPDGDTDLLNSEQKRKLKELYDDNEVAMYVGEGQSKDDSATGRPKMHGLKNLIADANIVTSPTNASAYKATDFIRDVFAIPDVDTILVSNEFRTGMTIWGYPLQRIDAGATDLGTRINAFDSPFTNGAVVIPCPLLPAYTAVGLAIGDVRIRYNREESWMLRGRSGDAVEGDWIARLSIELTDPELHTWVSGVTAFSGATS